MVAFPLTPAAAEIKRRRLERLKLFENPEDLGLQDQCLAFVTAGPPMLPYSYNSNYRIVQTNAAIVVHAEMIHDARVIYLDGRPHLPPRIRLWMGDSIGRLRSSSTPRTSTTAAASTGMPAAISAGIGICTWSSASVCSTPIRSCTSSRSTIQRRHATLEG